MKKKEKTNNSGHSENVQKLWAMFKRPNPKNHVIGKGTE